MTIEEALDYLKTWARVNAQEVYGSRREFIQIWNLENEIDGLKRTLEGER